MSKIALIGPSALVKNFSLLGVVPLPCENEREAEAAIEKIKTSKEYSIVLMVDYLAQNLLPAINQINQKSELNIVLVPSNRPSMGLALQRSKQLLKSALGSASV